MKLFDLNKKISTSSYQDNLFIDGEPTCDICLQKGINYIFNVEDETDDCIWVTNTKENTDVTIIKESRKEYDLFNIDDCYEIDKTKSIILDYMPFNVLDTYSGFYTADVISVLERFPLIDFIKNGVIEGANSNARAFITEFNTTIQNGKKYIVVTYDYLEGTFEDNENIRIVGIDDNDTLRRLKELNTKYSGIAQAFLDDVYALYQYPYTYNENQSDLECLEFRKFNATPDYGALNYDSFSREKVIDRGCGEIIQRSMTLLYSPNLVRMYDELLACDWDTDTIDFINSFPYYDFLKGQTIKGWFSKSVATVESVSVKNVNGNRYIVVCMNDSTGDFLPNEPIEVTSINKSDIWDAWNSEYATYGSISGLYDELAKMLTRPYQTADSTTNAVYTGQIDDIISEYQDKIDVVTSDCTILDNFDYELTIKTPEDLIGGCRFVGLHIPEDQMIFSIKILKDNLIPIGEEFYVKTNLVDFVENNGAMNGESFNVEIPAEYNEYDFYITNNKYSVEPVTVSVKKYSKKSSYFQLESRISEAIRCEFPNFFKFFQMYYAYTGQIGQGKDYLNNVYEYADIDLTIQVYLDNLAKENIYPFECEERLVQSRVFQKEFNNFWGRNGSLESYEYLFSVIYGKDAKIIDNCNKRFTSSGDDYCEKEYMFFKSLDITTYPFENMIADDFTTSTVDGLDITIDDLLEQNAVIPLDFFIDKEIKGVKTKSTAIISEAELKTDLCGFSYYKICVEYVRGKFESDELIDFKNVDIGSMIPNWLDYTDKRFEINGYKEALENLNVFFVNVGGLIEDNSTVVSSTGSRWYVGDKLTPIGTNVEVCNGEKEFVPFYVGEINTTLFVDQLDANCNPCAIRSDGCGNYKFNDQDEIVFERLTNCGNDIDHTVTVTINTNSISSDRGYWDSRSSFTDDIARLSDNFMLDPNTFILSVPLSRDQYFDVYQKTLHEAGSLMYSQYPVEAVINEDVVDDPCDATVIIEEDCIVTNSVTVIT